MGVVAFGTLSRAVLFLCCIGIQSRGSVKLPLNMLWLFYFLFMLPGVDAVCRSCFGDAPDCNGDTTQCPWIRDVAANAVAVTAAAGGIITLEKVLPNKFVRLFTRPVLKTLSLVVGKPKAGAVFDCAGKSGNEIYNAVKGGYITIEEAVSDLMGKVASEEAKDSPSEIKIKSLERAISVIQKSDLKVPTTEVSEGVFLFVLAKLSTIVCGDTVGSFDLCVEISDTTSSSGSSTSGSKHYAASLKRPKSQAQMFCLLHQFVMVSVACGLTTVIALCPFLDDVVFEPVRVGTLDWPVAFELMVCYLRMIENEPSRWRVSNVVHASGGMDAKRAEALVFAKGLYPASFFRALGGNPGRVKEEDDKVPKFHKSSVTGFNESSKKGCAAWNTGNSHLAKHVDGAGKCMFYHGCDQFVTDKGPGGQCLGAHKRPDCDYDSAKKCSKPHKP
jgi:hypothetical protein